MIVLSICILTYNNSKLLEECIESIISNTHNINFEIIIVDSGSTDNTFKMLEKFNNLVKIIKNNIFSGFSAGNNQAFKIARGEYILMLNDDTLILNNSIEKMYNFLHINPHAGAIGPRIFNTDKTHQYSSYLSHPGLFSDFFLKTIPFYAIYRFYIFFVNKNEADFYDQFGKCNGSVNKIREVKHLMGCCIMFKRNLLEKIGYLDENFFLSLEDQDFCARISKSKQGIFYLPESEIIHHGGQSTKHLNNFTNIYFDSRLYLQKKFYGIISTFFYKLFIILSSLLNLFSIVVFYYFIWDEKYKNYFKNAYKYNIKQLRYIYKNF